MAISVFSIEPGKDVFLGVAGDIQTLVSLIDLSTLRVNNVGLSLHGRMGPLGFSGEVTPQDIPRTVDHILEASQFGAHRSIN